MTWLPKIVPGFRAAFPGIDVQIYQGSYDDITGWLKTGAVELGFLSNSSAHDLDFEPLYDDRLICIAPPDYQPRRPGVVRAEELRSQPFVSQQSDVDADIQSYFKKNDLHVSSRCYIVDDQSMIAMVACGQGLALMPELMFKEGAASAGCQVLQLEPAAKRTIGLACLSRTALSPAAREFVEHARALQGSGDPRARGQTCPARRLRYCPRFLTTVNGHGGQRAGRPACVPEIFHCAVQQNTPVPLNRRRGVFIFLVSFIVLRYGHIRVLVGEVGGQGLHVLVHGLGHVLAVGDGLDDGARTLDGIAAGKDAGDARAAHLVGLKQAARGGFQILRAVGDRRAGALADGHNDTIRRVELFGAGNLGQRAVLGLVQVDKDDALVGDLQRLFVKDEVHALQLGIACLVLAGRNVTGQREALEMPRAVADGGARHVHGRVARADDDDPIAQVVDIGVLQIVDGVVHVAKLSPLMCSVLGRQTPVPMKMAL